MKKSAKRILFVLIWTLSLVLTGGCRNHTEDKEEVQGRVWQEDVPGTENAENSEGCNDGEEGITIGICLYSSQNEYTRRFADTVADYAKEQGIELIVYDGNYDADTQLRQIEQMIEADVDGLILNPQSEEECVACVERAYAAKIPIVSVNTRVNSDKITSYVGSDDVEAGEMIMEAAAQAIGGSGNVVILEGPLGQSAQTDRLEGIRRVLKEYPDIHVIGDKTANWSRLEAKNVMEKWLNTFDRVDAVVAENDDMALGALEAAEKAGVSVKIVGVDGFSEALEAILEGNMLMTVYQDAAGQGQTAIEVLLTSIRGGQTEDIYKIPFTKVTSENVKEYMSDLY